MDKKLNIKIVGKIELSKEKNKPSQSKKRYFKTHKEVNGNTFEDYSTNSLADFMPNHLKSSVKHSKPFKRGNSK